jgi:general secretion pathway protein J
MNRRPVATAGFTLIEVLVAIALMSLMTVTVWRGIDGMVRTHASLQARSEQVRGLQNALAQWRVDLDDMTDVGGVSTWSWDGQVLRLTRESGGTGAPLLQVVAWAWRADGSGSTGSGAWLRWQSPPCRSVKSWQQAWRDAQQWGRTPTDTLSRNELRLLNVQGWSLWVHRGGAWSHPLSSTDTTSGTNRPSGDTGDGQRRMPAGDADDRPPDAVRLMLDLPADSPFAGRLSVDWLRPDFRAIGS